MNPPQKKVSGITLLYRLFFFCAVFAFFGILIPFSTKVNQELELKSKSKSNPNNKFNEEEFNFDVFGVVCSIFGIIASLYGFSYSCRKDMTTTDYISIILLFYIGLDVIVLILLFNDTSAAIIPVVLFGIITILILFFCIGTCCCCRTMAIPYSDQNQIVVSIDTDTLRIIEETETEKMKMNEKGE